MGSAAHAEAAPIAPQNLDAEETVLGALLLAGASNQTGWVDRVRETGLQPLHFYRASHGRLYGLITLLADQGQPFDPVSVAARLDAGSDLTGARIHELAAIIPAIGLAPHHAHLVIGAHRRSRAYQLGQRLQTAALAGDIPPELNLQLQELLDQPGGHADIKPLWLDQAVNETIPDVRTYVDSVIQAGVLVDIVGLPYLHKSAIALELATKIAKGRGLFLGRFPIKQQTKTAYWWSDDGREQELERIQAHAAANDLAGRDLQVAFYLNSGIVLPDDLPTVKRQIREHGFGLVVFDSLYNFAAFDFVKDTAAVRGLYASLKRMCDETPGLTIILVDHASKPSESNRDRDDSIASYGSIFKAASVRCSIVVTKKGQSLFASATGNNIRGFPRSPVVFNQERLELTLLETQEPDPDRAQEMEQRVALEVRRQPGQSTNQIQKNVKGRNRDIALALARLAAQNLICDTYGTSSQLPGTNPDERTNSDPDTSSQPAGTKKHKTAWIPLNTAEKPRPGNNGTNPDEPFPADGSFPSESSSQTSSPYVVGGDWDEPEGEPQGSPPDERPPLDETLAPDPEESTELVTAPTRDPLDWTDT